VREVIIKVLLLAGLLCAAVFAYRGAPGALPLAIRRLALAGALGAAVVATLVPGLVTTVANLVGVGRGTDLVLYGLVVTSAFLWIGLYRRLHELEHRFVTLNRAIALERPIGSTSESDEAGAAVRPLRPVR
jgi:hypothetical protein